METRHTETCHGLGVEIAAGTHADYDALAHAHYRGAAPATFALILAARDAGSLAGVLVVSMPTLNASWRTHAWPDSARGTPRDRARWLNTNVRTISRVIVDQAHRGTGVATSLVRAYLARPLTRHTEAIAAMARWSPLFAHAGMRELATPACRRDAVLARELRRLGVRAWRLSDAREAKRVVRSAAVRRAIERWACASKATRRLDAEAWEIAALAAQRITAPPRVFVHDSTWKTTSKHGTDLYSKGER